MKKLNKKGKVLVLALATLAIALAAYAATPVPNIFENDTLADATKVNANFQDLVDKITALEALLDKTTISQVQYINAQGLTPIDGTAEIQWTLSELQAASSGASIISIEDDSGMTRTKFVASKACRLVTYAFYSIPTGGNNVRVMLNGAIVAVGTSGVNNASLMVGAAMILAKDDVVTFLATSPVSLTNFGLTMLITAETSVSSL